MRLGVHNYPAEAEEAGISIGARFESECESERLLPRVCRRRRKGRFESPRTDCERGNILFGLT